MISIYCFEDIKIQHIALMATGLGRRSFCISWYSETQTIVFDLFLSKGKLRNINHDLLESKKYQRVCIPSQEDGNTEGLSEINIYNWFIDFKKSQALFSIFHNNCARIVLNALGSGLGSMTEYSEWFSFIVTPEKIMAFAEHLSNKLIDSSTIWGIDTYLGSSCKLYTELDGKDQGNSINCYLNNAVSALLDHSNLLSLKSDEREFLTKSAAILMNLNRVNITITENFSREFFDVSAQIIAKRSRAGFLYKQIIDDSLSWLIKLHQEFSTDFNFHVENQTLLAKKNTK